MNTNGRRLNLALFGLSPRQRAILSIRAFKEDAPEPSGLSYATPRSQILEVNNLLAVASATHREITWYGIWLEARVESITLRFAVLGALRLRSAQNERLRMHLLLDAGEPVTDADYQTRVSTAREETLPVGELAVLLFECEVDAAELEGRQVEGTIATKEKLLRELIGAGTLPGKGKGKGLRIPAGAFYDWWGVPTPVLPEWGMASEVFPNSAAEQVARLHAQRETLRQLLSTGPGSAHERANLTGLDKGITETIAADLTTIWAELLALDDVVREATVAFDGEEPIHPAARGLLDETKERVLALTSDLSGDGFDLVLPTDPEPRATSPRWDH